MWRIGDIVVMMSIALNFSAMSLYLWQGHYWTAGYWACALGLNVCVMGGLQR